MEPPIYNAAVATACHDNVEVNTTKTNVYVKHEVGRVYIYKQ